MIRSLRRSTSEVRSLLTFAAAFGLVVTVAAPAISKTVSTRVKVVMKVPRTCKVHAPTMTVLHATVSSVLTVKSFIAGCTDDDIAAVLTLRADPADKRTDVATIDF